MVNRLIYLTLLEVAVGQIILYLVSRVGAGHLFINLDCLIDIFLLVVAIPASYLRIYIFWV